jgi:hypothetical protein
MYVLLTAANFPDIMMPVHNLNFGYSLFFIIYMVINISILLNILLAVIYTNYRNHLKVYLFLKVKANIILILKRMKLNH